MSITAEQAVRLVSITQRKADELFNELIAELEGNLAADGVETPTEAGGLEPTVTPTPSVGSEKVWSLGNTVLSGDWEESGRQQGATHTWADGNVDRYGDFVTYQGKGDYAPMRLALGYLANGDVVGFSLGAGGGSKRGITYFFPADDFATTNEKVSMIKGGGPRGRGGFGPADALPKAYEAFKTEILRDRVAGKWNVTAVVADAHDHKTMLGHTALQARLRRIF